MGDESEKHDSDAIIFEQAMEKAKPFLRAFPSPIPENACFDTVVSSQPFPPLRYPVTIIGWKHHPEEVHVTPSGALVFPRDDGTNGLYIAILAGSDKFVLRSPSPDGVSQQLVEGYMPGVESAWTCGGHTLAQTAFCILLDGIEVRTGHETLICISRYTIANTSPAPTRCTICFTFGTSAKGHSIMLPPPKWDRILGFRKPFIIDDRNNIVACILKSDVNSSFTSLPTAIDSNAAPNSLVVEFSLDSCESKSIDLAVPYFPISRDKADIVARFEYEECLRKFQSFWEVELNRNAEFVIPEKRIRDSYRACLAYNLVLVDRDRATGMLLPHPDATEYEHVWAGDSAVSIQAMDRLGYHDETREYFKCFFARQGTRKPDGDVSTFEGFFTGDAKWKWLSENGFILWALAEHYRLTGDAEWLRNAAPNIIKSCNWIIHERARTKTLIEGEKPGHWGLLPQGSPSDINIWDYWYWTDTYSYMGLRLAADFLSEIGMKSDSKRLEKEADDYRDCILRSLEISLNRQCSPPFVPPSPYRNDMPTREYLEKQWYSICSPIYMVEAGLLDSRQDKASWILHWLEELVTFSGLSAFGPGGIDPHYVYNQTLAYLLRGERAKFVWSFYSLFAYGQSSTTYATLECQNLVTGSRGLAWDANRQPHMHSNSRVIDMVRCALILEEGNLLHLLPGTPTDWLAEGKIIEIKNAPTYFGNVNLRAVSNIAKRKISIIINPPTRKPTEVILHLHPPTEFGEIKSVKICGKIWSKFSGRRINLGVIGGKTEVECRF